MSKVCVRKLTLSNFVMVILVQAIFAFNKLDSFLIISKVISFFSKYVLKHVSFKASTSKLLNNVLDINKCECVVYSNEAEI